MNLFLDYAAIKSYLSHLTHLSSDAIHLHVGLIVIVVACWARQPAKWIYRAMFFLVFLNLVNEALDLGRNGLSSWPLSVKDVINTLLWPTVISITCLRLLALREDDVSQDPRPSQQAETSQPQIRRTSGVS